MAIIKCPECGKEISDKAELCIGCGFPITDAIRFELNNTPIEEQLARGKELLDKKKYDKAYEIYIKLANQEVGEAEYIIGRFCDQSYGYFKNTTGMKEIEWWERAAEHGSANGAAILASCYEGGHGCKKNQEKALLLYEKSYKNGNNYALVSIGNLYGKMKNYEKAIEYYKKGTEKGERFAFYKIGCYYEGGKGVEKNINTAKKYYKRAAELGDSYAKKKLKELSGNVNCKQEKLQNESPAYTQEEPQIKCPTCGSKNVSKISAFSRGVSIWAWGAFSNKINKTFKCENCGYTW